MTIATQWRDALAADGFCQVLPPSDDPEDHEADDDRFDIGGEG